MAQAGHGHESAAAGTSGSTTWRQGRRRGAAAVHLPCPTNDPPRTRTWNLRLRRPTPYPLGQRTCRIPLTGAALHQSSSWGEEMDEMGGGGGGGQNEVLGRCLCVCSGVCGWPTLTKLLGNHRKTRFEKGKAGSRQHNLCQIMLNSTNHGRHDWQQIPCLCQSAIWRLPTATPCQMHRISSDLRS